MTTNHGSIIHEIAEEIGNASKDAVLLSEIAVSSEHMDYIHRNLFRILSGPDSDDYCIVSAYALMDVGTRNYEGKELWPGVERECRDSAGPFGTEFTFNSNDHKTWFNRFKKGVTALGMKWNFDVGRIQVDNILVHTFVPDVQMDKFMKFVDGFYNNVLDGSLDDLDEYLPLIPTLVSRSSISEEDDNVNSIFPDSSLNKSTRKVLSDVYVFKPLLTRILKMVHSIYTYERLDDHDYNRYYKAFNEYLDSRVGRRSSGRSSHRASAHLKLRDGELFIVLPEKICNIDDELSVLIGDKRIPTDYQPIKINLDDSGKCHINAVEIPFDSLLPNLSPFDDFQLILGSVLWKSHSRRRFLLFDLNGRPINKPCEGQVLVYVKEDCHIEPDNRIQYRQDETVCVDLKKNDVLTIGDQSMKVQTQSITETDILFDTISNVTVTDSFGNHLDLLDYEDIQCEIAQPAGFTYVLRMTLDDGETSHIQINRDSDKTGAITNYYRDKEGCSFSIPLKMFGNEPHIVNIGIYEQNSRKIVEKRFLHVPELEFGFNKDVYCTPESGFFHSSVLNDEIEFSVTDEYVEWDLETQSGTVHFKHVIPSVIISLDNGSSWIYPPYAPVPFMDLFYDHLLVRNGSESNIRISCTGIPLKSESLGKDRKYDLVPVKERVLKNKDKTPLAFFIPAVGRSKPFELFKIMIKNEYLFDKQSKTVTMCPVAGMKAVARYSLGNKIIKEIVLEEGVNDIGYQYTGGVIFSVCEYNYLTGEYDLTRMTEQMGDDYSCIFENGIVFLLNLKDQMNPLELHNIQPGAIRADFDRAIGYMKRYNKWLNDSNVIKKLWNSFESLGKL